MAVTRDNFIALMRQTNLPEHLQMEVVDATSVVGIRQLQQLVNLGSIRSDNSELLPCAELFVAAADAIMALRSGSSDNLVELLRRSLKYPDWQFGRMCIPMVLDIIQYELPLRPIEAARLVIVAVREFELAVFRYLPDEEVRRLVSRDIVFFIEKLSDIVADFRWMYYVAAPVYDHGVWGKQFYPLLQANQELLGQKIIVSGAELAPTVQQWLVEYEAFTGLPGPQREALDRLKFVQESTNARPLSESDRAVLLKLCELADWFADPYVTEVEVGEFEDLTPATQRAGMVRQDAAGEEETAVEEESAPAATIPDVAKPAFASSPVRPVSSNPNVQGVLISRQFGAQRTGLSVSLSEADAKNVPPAPAPKTVPAVPNTPEVSSSKEVVETLQSAFVPSATAKPKAPAAAPAPVVLAARQQSATPPLSLPEVQELAVPPELLSRPTAVTVQPVAPHAPVPAPKTPPAATPPPSPPKNLPPLAPNIDNLLKMKKLKMQAGQVRAQFQSGIDERLEELKDETGSS